MNFEEKITEQSNIQSENIDMQSIRQILDIINNEDRIVADAVKMALPQIEEFIELAVNSFRSGGRLFYVGSGTSGRLGVLDATECPPTFSVEREMVQGIIAGGSEALVRSIEGAEDHTADGAEAIIDFGITNTDCVLGIASSGTTPYVKGALQQAFDLGAKTGFLICNNAPDLNFVDVMISVIVGPEVITGSTRMKAGTATKLVLNMITTTTMIKLNKTYGNLMVDLNALNKKLWDRGTRLIQHFKKMEYESAKQILKSANGEVKTAIVMAKLEVNYNQAKQQLNKNNGALREVIG